MAIVGLLTAVLPLFGFQITDNVALEQIVTAVIFIGIAIDRLFKKDISVLGLKKTD